MSDTGGVAIVAVFGAGLAILLCLINEMRIDKLRKRIEELEKKNR